MEYAFQLAAMALTSWDVQTNAQKEMSNDQV